MKGWSLAFNVLALSWNRTRYAVPSCHGLHCNWVMQLNLLMCQACRAVAYIELIDIFVLSNMLIVPQCIYTELYWRNKHIEMNLTLAIYVLHCIHVHKNIYMNIAESMIML